MSLIILIFLLQLIPSVSANNDGNVTDTVGWVSDPSGRGTFSLISSCILTLGLCVWSAMHLNIPPHNEKPTATLYRTIKWSVTGIVAPELVVFAAWRQYNSAKTLNTKVQEYIRIQPLNPAMEIVETPESSSSRSSSKSENTEKQQRWSMVHSFYAGMGGFFIDREMLPGHEEGSGDRLILTARGVALLAQCGRLPRIDKDDIEDKNKADSLAKSLVCAQAAWMVVQVCTRIGLGLPVTLLEVNTLGHVFCALVIYLLWWNKPRLIRESTKVEGDWVAPLCSYMYMSSQISGYRSHRVGLLLKQRFDPELDDLALFVPQTRTGSIAAGPTVDKQLMVNKQGSEISISRGSISNTSGPATEKKAQPFDGNMDQAYFGPRPAVSTNRSDGLATTEKAHFPLARWSQAAEAVRTYPAVRQRFLLSDNTPQNGLLWLEPNTEELITRVAGNWPSEDLLRGTGGLVIGMVLWFASMSYGGIHVAAWNGFFPSRFEEWMWRAAAVHVTASGALWMVINLLAALSKSIDAYWDRIVALQASWLSYIVIGFLCTVCGVSYIVARIFLVVEAFISIRQLPAPAYMTPDWTQVIPHF